MAPGLQEQFGTVTTHTGHLEREDGAELPRPQAG